MPKSEGTFWLTQKIIWGHFGSQLSHDSLADVLSRSCSCHDLNHTKIIGDTPSQLHKFGQSSLITPPILSSDFFHPWNSLVAREPGSNHFWSHSCLPILYCSISVHRDTFLGGFLLGLNLMCFYFLGICGWMRWKQWIYRQIPIISKHVIKPVSAR